MLTPSRYSIILSYIRLPKGKVRRCYLFSRCFSCLIIGELTDLSWSQITSCKGLSLGNFSDLKLNNYMSLHLPTISVETYCLTHSKTVQIIAF